MLRNEDLRISQIKSKKELVDKFPYLALFWNTAILIRVNYRSLDELLLHLRNKMFHTAYAILR